MVWWRLGPLICFTEARIPWSVFTEASIPRSVLPKPGWSGGGWGTLICFTEARIPWSVFTVARIPWSVLPKPGWSGGGWESWNGEKVRSFKWSQSRICLGSAIALIAVNLPILPADKLVGHCCSPLCSTYVFQLWLEVGELHFLWCLWRTDPKVPTT